MRCSLSPDFPVIWSYLNNIPVFGTTVNPVDNSFKQPTDINLQWSCSDPDGDGIKYNVYIGQDPDQLTLVSENQNESSCIIHGLDYGTRYFWLIEAVDSRGTISRSPIRHFTTIHETNSIVDIDGNTYRTVKIGNQWWMSENLSVTKYRNGVPIPLVTNSTTWRNLTSGAYDYYNNDISNKPTYGVLYNWYTVSTGNLCPLGWHVPSINDLAELETFLISNGYGYGNTPDAIAKSLAADYGWAPVDSVSNVGNDQASNNTTGFCALPGAWKNWAGGFDNLGFSGVWWLSTLDENNNAMQFSLFYWSPFLWKGADDRTIFDEKTWGFSIRCIQD